MFSRALPARIIIAMLLTFTAILSAVYPVHAEVIPLTDLNEFEFEQRTNSDIARLHIYRKGLQSILDFMASEPTLFPTGKLREPRMLKAAQKEEILATWKMALDYTLALDSIGRHHRKYYTLQTKAMKQDSFAIYNAAFLAQYAFALDFIPMAQRDPGVDKLLNEPVPDLGLPGRTYARFKLRFLNLARATEFGALNAMGKFLGASGRAASLSNGASADKRVIMDAGYGSGPVLTMKNAADIVRDAGATAWFPVQAGVSEWMGDTRVHRKARYLISQDQIRELLPLLQPGDILLERREWYLSNVGLPGFWPHAALYIGTPAERLSLKDDPEVAAWVREQGVADGDFEALLRTRYPETYDAGLQPLDDSHLPRVIEALSEGVCLTTIEHSAAADSLAVLRPRLSNKEKAIALERAFKFRGRPYDFDFDFLTDAALVCTEVIYKAFEPSDETRGLRFPITKVMGHMVTPANEIVRQFDANFGTPEQQTDLILFLDGHEKSGTAIASDLAAFRASWQRPKWHILMQDDLNEE